MKAQLAILVTVMSLISCDTAEPPPLGEGVMKFQALDASCTEVWLEVKLAAGALPRTLTLQRDSVTILTTTLSGTDTVVVDEGLSPNREYTYTLTRPAPTLSGPAGIFGDRLSAAIRTMDTTSHNFTWRIDTLGVTSSVLYDVAIINDTLAYAVGEIFLNDSTGQLDPVYYNVAKWNGRRWECFRILSNCRLYYPNCGPVTHTVSTGKAIFAFAWNDIWIAAGGIHHFDGSQWIEHRAIVEVGSTNRIWGSSSTNLWLVGNNGLIIHYNGSTWQRVESGTTLPIMDVYGATKPQSGSNEILAVAEAYGAPGASKIYSVENNTAREITALGLDSWGVGGIWFVPDRQYIVIGQGVWRAHAPNGTWWVDDNLPRIASTSITGNTLNDIVVGGAFRLLAHWNGVRWQTFFPRTSSSDFVGVRIRSDFIVAVGGTANRAMALTGRR